MSDLYDVGRPVTREHRDFGDEEQQIWRASGLHHYMKEASKSEVTNYHYGTPGLFQNARKTDAIHTVANPIICTQVVKTGLPDTFLSFESVLDNYPKIIKDGKCSVKPDEIRIIQSFQSSSKAMKEYLQWRVLRRLHVNHELLIRVGDTNDLYSRPLYDRPAENDFLLPERAVTMVAIVLQA